MPFTPAKVLLFGPCQRIQVLTLVIGPGFHACWRVRVGGLDIVKIVGLVFHAWITDDAKSLTSPSPSWELHHRVGATILGVFHTAFWWSRLEHWSFYMGQTLTSTRSIWPSARPSGRIWRGRVMRKRRPRTDCCFASEHLLGPTVGVVDMDTPKKPPIEAINRSPWSAGSWFFSSISTAQTLKLVSPCATHGLGHQEAIGSSFPLCARRGSAPGRTSYKICACPCPWKHPPSM